MRDAAERDIPAIQAVARASWTATYAEIYTREFIDTFLAQAYSTESLERSIQRAASGAGSHFLVAERDGELVGFLHFAVGQHGPQLYRLYAAPEHYDTGIGKALLEALEERLDSVVERYILYVHEGNERGRRFYARRGFLEVGRGGELNDEIVLERRPADAQASRNSSTSRS